MILAFKLWRELTSDRVRLQVSEDGNLCFRAPPSVMSETRKSLVIQHKKEIIEILEAENVAEENGYSLMDFVARKEGWLILSRDEAYYIQFSPVSTVYLLHDNDNTWRVWRGSWRKGQSTPFSEKTIAKRLSFQDALSRGNQYVTWCQKRAG